MFKFYSFDEKGYWKTPFIEKQIHFDSFKNFNDSFEGFFNMTGEGSFEVKYKKLKEWSPGNAYINSLDTEEKIKAYLEGANFNVNRNAFLDSLANYGISCFSKECDQILMWAHYARKQSGFCLEFDQTAIQSAGENEGLYFQDVCYIDSIPNHSIFDDEPIERLLKYKFKDWEYEREIRAVKNSPGLLSIPATSIKSIILGERFLGTPHSTELRTHIEQYAPDLRDSVKIISRKKDAYALVVKPLSWIAWK